MEAEKHKSKQQLARAKISGTCRQSKSIRNSYKHKKYAISVVAEATQNICRMVVGQRCHNTGTKSRWLAGLRARRPCPLCPGRNTVRSLMQLHRRGDIRSEEERILKAYHRCFGAVLRIKQNIIHPIHGVPQSKCGCQVYSTKSHKSSKFSARDGT